MRVKFDFQKYPLCPFRGAAIFIVKIVTMAIVGAITGKVFGWRFSNLDFAMFQDKVKLDFYKWK